MAGFSDESEQKALADHVLGDDGVALPLEMLDQR
jgi:hypothetical protein